MKRATAKNLPAVLRKFAEFVEGIEEVEPRRDIAYRLNALLDELSAEDCFGTEGQCDPRGDQR